MEKARERKIRLHSNFIDFKLAFDFVWCNALWKMLRAIGVNIKIIDIIEYMYEKTECAVPAGLLSKAVCISCIIHSSCAIHESPGRKPN